MAEIVLRDVTKTFAGSVNAVDRVNLTVADGEFMVLVGPSGCGKSTLMRIVAGLEDPTEGSVEVGGRDVTHLPPRQRDIAMVFQNYALYPHMTVRNNLGYPLKIRGIPKREARELIERVSTMLGLDELLDRRPTSLSGGQRQRVAIGRAIVREPQVFLMDEPLSNLDAKLRVGMRAELARLHSRLKITTVYVTHDQVEAMTLGQRVAVMRSGSIQQVDSPQALYRSPVNLFVAAFMGSPSMNLIKAHVDGTHLHFGGFHLPLDPANRPPVAGDVIAGIRPHAFEDSAFADSLLPRISVEPAILELLGSEVHVIFAVDAPAVRTDDVKAVFDDADVATLLADDDRAQFTARVNGATRAEIGVPLELAVDPRLFHFFDVATGKALTTGHVADHVVRPGSA